MSDFTWGNCLRLGWVVVGLSWGVGGRSRLHFQVCKPHQTWLTWHHPVSVWAHILSNPCSQTHHHLSFSPHGATEEAREETLINVTPSSLCLIHSTRNRKQKETAAALVNCYHVEQEKHHVESVRILQSHTSPRISLLPCTLQVCYNNPNVYPDCFCFPCCYSNLLKSLLLFALRSYVRACVSQSWQTMFLTCLVIKWFW